ncbi:MAG: chemotaxis protein CheA [Nitrospinota bacterium]
MSEMEMMDPEVFQEYLAEVFESLEGLDEKYVRLEKSPQDVQIIDSIFRPVHSIKGSSAFFGLNHVKNFAHKLENLLDDLRKGKKKVTQVIIDNLLIGTDFLKAMFQRVTDGDTTFESTPEETEFIETLEERIIGEEEKKAPDIDFYLFKMSALIEKLKAAGAHGGEFLSELEQNLIMARTLAGSLDDEPKVQKLGEILVEKDAVSSAEVDGALKDQKPDEKIGELLVKSGATTHEVVEEAVDVQKKQVKEVEKEKISVQKTMRISEGKVDEFMAHIGELVIISEVFNYLEKRLNSLPGSGTISKEFKNVNMNFSELTLLLQHGLSEVRKVALKSLFQKIPRLVRDLAASLGKDVRIEIEGEGVMVDKSLLEKFESPIIHMVRNAVDHGIEMPDVRKKNGKPASGKVELKAEISGDTLIVKLIDDGGGISRAKLVEKAVKKGILTAAEADTLKDCEVFDYIFHPGFSTAEKVTDVSGRGVGMDVVKSAMTELKGKIEIDSELGKGSTFTISLPVTTTLVTINGLIVAVGNRKFIFPVEDVKESIRPGQDEIFMIKDRTEMINLRGNIYPLIRIYKNFNIETEVTDPLRGVGIVIEKNGQKCCVMADEVVEQQNVVLKDLGSIFRHIRGVKGGAILGDGSIGLVLNVDGLMGNS